MSMSSRSIFAARNPALMSSLASGFLTNSLSGSARRLSGASTVPSAVALSSRDIFEATAWVLALAQSWIWSFSAEVVRDEVLEGGEGGALLLGENRLELRHQLAEMRAALLDRLGEGLDLLGVDRQDDVLLLAADPLDGCLDLFGEPHALGGDAGEEAQALVDLAHIDETVGRDGDRQRAEQRHGEPDLRDDPDPPEPAVIAPNSEPSHAERLRRVLATLRTRGITQKWFIDP